MQASTGFTPFYVNYGRHPYSPLALYYPPAQKLEEKVAVTAFAERMQRLYREVRLGILKAQQRQCAQANKTRRDVQFEVGDRVWLHSSFRRPHMTVMNAKPKLNPSWLGPFSVKRVINPVVYELELPPAYQKIHPVFHASFLRECQDGGDQFPGRPDRVPVPPPDLIEEEEHFWVDCFLNHRYVSHKKVRYLQWLVRWKGFGETYDSWEFDDDLMEDLDVGFYSKVRAEYEKAAHIPTGTEPPDVGKAEPAKAKSQVAPAKESALPSRNARQTRALARRVAA